MTSHSSSNRPMPSDPSAQQASSLPQMSIIIPVYNGAHIIGPLLDSIQQLDYPPDRYEVIVIDNNSTDDLEGAIAAYPVKLLHEHDVQGSYAARNRGIRQARGEILAFTDVDCRVHPQWLRCLQAAFRDETVGGAAGTIKGVEPAKSWVEEVLNQRHHMSSVDHRRSANGHSPKLKRSFKRPTRWLPRLLKQLGLVTYWYDPRLPSLPIAPTANVAYKREAFEKVGYFDDTFISGGDAEFAIRMQQHTAMQLVAAPDAIVYHRHRASLRQLWRVYARYEIGHVALVEKLLGLDDDLRRQLLVENLVYLMIGVPWSSAKLVFRALRSAFLAPPHPLYVQEIIVDLVTSTSRLVSRMKVCHLLHRGHGEELWMP